MARSAVCEKILYDLVSPSEKEQRDESLLNDSPDRLSLPPEIRTEKMQEIVKNMEEAMNAPGTNEEKKVRETDLLAQDGLIC